MKVKTDAYDGWGERHVCYLGWKNEIRSLGDPHVPFNPSLEHDKSVANQYGDL